MAAVELVTREYGGHVIIELSGELDIADATKLATALSAAMACTPQTDVNLTPRGPCSSVLTAPPRPFWVITWTIEPALR
jgi:hypothetical protein